MTFPDSIGAATPQLIGSVVSNATHRLIVLAPALTMDIARLIEERWIALGPERVSITLDVDPEVYRLGYGDPAALSYLENIGRRAGGLLQRHRGIRIGVIVSDDATLVYAPIPELIEAGPRDVAAPNALLIRGLPPDLLKAVGFGECAHQDQTVGLDKATRNDIAELHEDLKLNPPQRFDIQRQLRVFNAAFQFVELRVLGTNVARRTVPLPTSLLGVMDQETREELRMTLRLVPPTHALSGTEINTKRQRIEKRHLTVVAGYGQAILRTAKEQFLRDVETLKTEVDAFRARVTAKLDEAIDAKIQQLVEAFLPRLREAPPSNWLLPKEGPARESALKECLTEDLHKALRSANDYVREMRVDAVFKDVTYESLQNEKFMQAARAAFPRSLVPQIYHEFEAAPSQSGVSAR